MRYEVLIPGMVAIHARNAVFTALAAVPGVVRAEVELGRAVVAVEAPMPEGALRAAIAAAGFEVGSVRALPRELPLA